MVFCVFVLETYSGYKKPFAELIQFLPSDIRSYFEDLHGEYQANLQTDTVAEFDVNRVAARRKLMLDCSMTAFTVCLVSTLISG